ncbi:hypothetical protein ABFS83_10G068600 [Erythranthe nasuta]
MGGSDNSNISRHDFATDFVFGAATSAYQIEGGYKEGGKAFSIWDTFSITKPAKISDGSNGCLAIDHYNKFKEDIDLMKKLGVDAYRLSLAWTRILPGGRLSGGVNREGVKFYNDIIDYSLSKGIQPYVTIFHWDTPTFLQEESGGFASPKIVQDFAEYVEVCFFEFGDRVKHWITINESWTYTHHGYITGDFPPNHGTYTTDPAETTASSAPNHKKTHRCARGVDQSVFSGSNPGTEPYLVAHHLILAHAAAVEIYRRDYQAQKGIIGVTNVSKWFIPLKDTKEDIKAAARAVDFMWGWFLAPIVRGEYPPVMRERVGDRLPVFTPEQNKTHRCGSGVDQTVSPLSNPGTEPYEVAHNLILAHAAAVEIYRRDYQEAQKGIIGVTNVSKWFLPLEDTEEDKAAASRAVDFMWGWFMAPIVRGDYPPVMRERVGDRLPVFTAEETKMVKGSYDFIGLNYYTTNYASYKPTPPGTPPTYWTDQEVELHTKRCGIPIGEQGGSEWLFVVPEGFYELIVHTYKVYDNPLIYVTENGYCEKNNKSLTITEARVDKPRINYHQDHFAAMKNAITVGARVKGYFVWSLLDNYEWAEGYTVRFGMIYVDYGNGLTRYPKSSAIWFMNFLSRKTILYDKRQVEEIETSNKNPAKRPSQG